MSNLFANYFLKREIGNISYTFITCIRLIAEKVEPEPDVSLDEERDCSN